MIGLGVWQLKRAQVEGAAARADTRRPRSCRRSLARPCRCSDDQLPLFRHATGVCLRPSASARSPARIAAGETGYVADHRLRDRRRRAGDERRGRLVEEPECEGRTGPADWSAGSSCPTGVPGMRLVAASAPPGLEPSRRRRRIGSRSPGRPSRLCVQWFSFAAIALVIYGLALRKRLRRSSPSHERRAARPGQRPDAWRVDPMPSARRSRSGSTRSVGSRSEPAHLNGLAQSSSIWCSRARAAATAREISRSDRGCRRGAQCVDRARPDRVLRPRAGHATCRLVVELLADLVRAPHFDEEHLEREKKVILSELGEVDRHARRPGPRSSVRSGVRRAAARPVRCSARRDHPGDHARRSA